jgi:hypothetical protein
LYLPVKYLSPTSEQKLLLGVCVVGIWLVQAGQDAQSREKLASKALDLLTDLRKRSGAKHKPQKELSGEPRPLEAVVADTTTVDPQDH